MGDFVPPYPRRFRYAPNVLQRLMSWRSDLLSLWEEGAFEYDFASQKILTRRVFLCNSPESVQFALGANHENFGSKSPEMRRVLAPLVGDGLFVSGGETWRSRRRVVAPVVHVSKLPQF